ncbi:MAG: efflux RND transporter periplasmic adaptor subunit [Desulfamplus sp.]|nr:efflux RND transporter periplasmic adaptor subunit [Desulfamplus sp.]MBF0390650.1 efflux RND transporter periplasmic adaptor subunit [Desulfamplus sp.]
MNSEDNYKPRSSRAKILYFIWRSIPRVILLGMIVLIMVLFGTIKDKMKSIETEKASALIKDKPLINTVIMPLKLRTITESMNLPGSIEPWTDLTLKSEIHGSIVEILVKEGDEVKSGEVIARVQTDDYKIALSRAEANYKLAVAELNRDKVVYSKGIVSQAQIEAKQTNVALASTEVANARLMLNRCVINSPISGVITKLDAKKGLLLSVGDPVCQIVQMDRVKAVVGIPESDMPAVATINHVELNIKALNDLKVTGEKYFLSPISDTLSRIYRLELALENQDRKILPGMFIRANIIKQEVKKSVAIPFYSVISRGDEQFVFIEENGVAIKKEVSLGIMQGWLVEIKEGLEAGQNLIVEGHRDIEDGQAIKVVHTVTELEEYGL